MCIFLGIVKQYVLHPSLFFPVLPPINVCVTDSEASGAWGVLLQGLSMVQPWPAGTRLARRHNRWLLTESLFCQVDFSLIIFSLHPATLLRLHISVCVQLRDKHLSQFHKNKSQPAAELVRKPWWGRKLFKSCHHAVFSHPTCVKRVDLLSYKLRAWAGELVMTPITLK